MTPNRLYAVVVVLAVVQPLARSQSPEPRLPGGELRIMDEAGRPAGVCPLKHTAVEADIVGYVARVTVKQVFHNPTSSKIEAVYVFPLPQNAAVDDMTMVIGERRIVGKIKERGEAREIYELAKAAGHVTSLLDQERPNIFTQAVANIEPGVEVAIEISFVETLKYEEGVFEWVFPMVVGPRYIPGGGTAPAPMTTGQPTLQVPDAHRITPPVTPEGTRAGHDISLQVSIHAGAPLVSLESVLHDVVVTADAAWADVRPGREVPVGWASVELENRREIPNRDFVLRFSVAAEGIGDAFLVHEDERGRFFTIVLHPPQRVVPRQVVPRELIFVLDTSGSMQGFPIEKAKAVMLRLVDTMNPQDTFNVITFAGDTHVLWPVPRPADVKRIAEAKAFLRSRQGRGGTEMMKAIEAALIQTRDDAERVYEPCQLNDVPADGRTVKVYIDADDIVHWPPPYVRSSWSGPALRTGGGVMDVVELAGAPAGAESTGRTRGLATACWRRQGQRAVLEIQDFTWVGDPGCDAGVTGLATLADLAGLPADGRYVVVKDAMRGANLDAVLRAAPTFDLRLNNGESIHVRAQSWSVRTGLVDEQVGVPVRLEGRWTTVNGERVLEADLAAYADGPAPRPLRVVCFMTDGYVGNDMAIIGAVKKHADTTRVFSFGIGNSVNRFLLEGMAHAGRGEVEFVTLHGEADGAAGRFHERVLAPVLTDIEIDWGSLEVEDVYPKQIPDLFSVKPMMIHGRLVGEAGGIITLRGWTGAGAFEEQIEVRWPGEPPDHAALPSLWARSKVEHLMMQDYGAAQTGQFPPAIQDEVIRLGLAYRLMTQYTSFVAVEEMRVTAGGEPVRIDVPVEMPEGVSYEGIFGGACTVVDRLYSAPQAKMRRFGGARGRTRAPAGAMVPPPAPTRGLAAGTPISIGSQGEEAAAGGRPTDQSMAFDKDGRLELESPPARDPRDKLAPPLRDCAERVDRESTDGNLTIGKLKIIDYRVDVMIFLDDLSKETVDALKQLGFKQTGKHRAAKLLIGSIEVWQLEALAKLDAVIRVKPVVAP
jgi:hypothetical protein